jgi:hypothetical protein
MVERMRFEYSCDSTMKDMNAIHYSQYIVTILIKCGPRHQVHLLLDIICDSTSKNFIPPLEFEFESTCKAETQIITNVIIVFAVTIGALRDCILRESFQVNRDTHKTSLALNPVRKMDQWRHVPGSSANWYSGCCGHSDIHNFVVAQAVICASQFSAQYCLMTACRCSCSWGIGLS